MTEKLWEISQDIPMDPVMRDKFTSWIYRNWTTSYDNLKAAKAMVFDKRTHGDKTSYEMAKAMQIQRATEEYNYWQAALDKYKDYAPIIQSEKARTKGEI